MQWKYLHVHDGTAEICDARDLIGKDTLETEDAVRAKLDKQCSVYGIGPAGENLVRYAAIFGDHGHVAAHNGLGAVMGSKKLKAIVAERGHQAIEVADPERHNAAVKEFAQNFHDNAASAVPVRHGRPCRAGKKAWLAAGEKLHHQRFPRVRKFYGPVHP